MRHLSTWLFIIFFSMCTVTACVHPVGSITREDIENSGGGNSGGGSDNPGSGNPDPGSGGGNEGGGSGDIGGDIGFVWQG